MAMTLAQLSRQIEADLDWRHAELAMFRELLTLNAGTSVRRATLFRGAWAILYAHYEGFCKTSLELLVEFMEGLPDCSNLSDNTFLFLHEKAMREARNKSNSDAFDFFRSQIDQLKASSPPSINIETKSNLWPNVLEDILSGMDISSTPVITDRAKIRTLGSGLIAKRAL
ncbi:MAE_28990/MAE_18760 family HEPN-like nuclease [Brevundimonas diminuta]|uniref:MAE_28990/MAE_18760 family HEPN-like nuclease n=1 Tax=Brevundimonas diminuta TaxID=293 RepID=UPI003D9A958D